jgi:hypothetical protein
MNAHGDQRGRQELAAAALAVGKTQWAAAQTAGVSERTVRTWWADPAFRARVAKLRGEAVSRALGRLTAGMTDAADTFLKLLKSPNDAVRLGAAKAIIELAIKVRDATDLQAVAYRMLEEMDEMKGVISGSGDNSEALDELPRPDGFGDDPNRKFSAAD